MGVTIHYRGSLNQKTQIHHFIEEVQDICESMDWDYNIMDEDWDKTPKVEIADRDEKSIQLGGHASLKGIIFKPNEECERVVLTFNREGTLNSIINIAMGHEAEEDGFPWVFTKTQFAGVEAHISIIKLLKYLKSKYISNLEVIDEGNYWDTGDSSQVSSRIQVINNAMDAIEKGLAELGDRSELTHEQIMDKIQEIMSKISEQQGVEVKVLRIDKILKDKNIDLDFDRSDIDDPSLN